LGLNSFPGKIGFPGRDQGIPIPTGFTNFPAMGPGYQKRPLTGTGFQISLNSGTGFFLATKDNLEPFGFCGAYSTEGFWGFSPKPNFPGEFGSGAPKGPPVP